MEIDDSPTPPTPLQPPKAPSDFDKPVNPKDPGKHDLVERPGIGWGYWTYETEVDPNGNPAMPRPIWNPVNFDTPARPSPPTYDPRPKPKDPGTEFSPTWQWDGRDWYGRPRAWWRDGYSSRNRGWYVPYHFGPSGLGGYHKPGWVPSPEQQDAINDWVRRHESRIPYMINNAPDDPDADEDMDWVQVALDRADEQDDMNIDLLVPPTPKRRKPRLHAADDRADSTIRKNLDDIDNRLPKKVRLLKPPGKRLPEDQEVHPEENKEKRMRPEDYTALPNPWDELVEYADEQLRQWGGQGRNFPGDEYQLAMRNRAANTFPEGLLRGMIRANVRNAADIEAPLTIPERIFGRNVGPNNWLSSYAQAYAEGPISLAAWRHDLAYDIAIHDTTNTLDIAERLRQADERMRTDLLQVPPGRRGFLWHAIDTVLASGIGEGYGRAYRLWRQVHDIARQISRG